jgi:exopolyphosphatase/guanosine-5'-triphosphate,3'-diphosphate pyrophosphatase
VTRLLRVKNVYAIATAAVRDAADGREFIRRGEQACGTKIQILSGEREAELAAFGIRMGFNAADGIAGDLGGGSLELTDIQNDTLRAAMTLPLGGLRLIDVGGGKLEKATEITDAEMARIGWAEAGAGRPFFAVGGTWRALAKMHMAARRYPLRVMQGYAIPAREAIAFCEDLRKGKRPPGWDDISKARREVLPYGAMVLERVLRRLGSSQVVFSVFGIREGLLFSLMSPHERAKDPLISFCEDFARLRSRSPEHASELGAWTDPLFVEPGPKETPDERRLRHAACLLSDTGWRAHPDYRGEQSLDLIAYAAMTGVDHPGRAFLAMSVYFRHVGPDEEEDGELATRLAELVDKRMLKRARIVGAAIRTAHMISIGQAGLIPDIAPNYERDRLVLTIPPAFAALDGERLRRRFQALGDLLDRKTEIRIGRSTA